MEIKLTMASNGTYAVKKAEVVSIEELKNKRKGANKPTNKS